MSDSKKVDIPLEGDKLDNIESNIAVSTSGVSSVAGSVKTAKTPQRISSSSDRQIKFERAQKALENAALVSKRIKEHRKATAELLGRPFEEDDAGDTASEMASTMSERTGYSVATDTSTTLSVKEALNIPGISESLANTLKQKELLMERIKQYKEISKRPSLIKSASISKKESIADIKADVKKTSENTDLTQLINTVKEKENLLSVMQVKMKAMETTILDLQEKINEKDQIIEAKNMATTLMSDSLSKKDKDSMILLEDTRQQMTKMQENFVSMESEWKEERQKLLKEIDIKDEKIKHLEEANTILENARFEISLAHSKLAEELDLKNKEIEYLTESIEKISKGQEETFSVKEAEDIEEEKGSKEIANMVELTKKIELLEELNCQIRQTNKELENKLATISDQKLPAASSPVKKGSPLPGRKGKNVATKMKSPWSNLSSESLPQETDKKSNKNEITKLEMLVKSLNKEILDKEYIISQKDSLIEELNSSNSEKEAVIIDLKNEPKIVTVDIGTETVEIIQSPEIVPELLETELSNINVSLNVVELQDKLKAAQEQIDILNADIDTANKNMIKVKSNHKLKVKQMQKTIENFSMVSDANAEIVRLNEELHQLSQKVAELEEEKGNLQLHLVDYDSGRLTDTEIYKKMVEMENLAESRLRAISVLETQKFDLVQELHVLQQKYVEMEDKLADISQFQNDQVCSEMKSVQLEEQIDELTASRKELELIIDNLKLDKERLNGDLKNLQEEKEEILHKLENYIQENIDLTDKLEKLSAEKVSSAESIEIVESLTTQEKLELEEYNKGKVKEPLGEEFKEAVDENDGKNTIQSLMEQSDDLNKKIELFTLERQEVMEKMSRIQTENEQLLGRIIKLNIYCNSLKANIELLNNEKCELHTLNESLNQQIEELKRERMDIMKETVELTKPRVSVVEESPEIPGEIQQDDKLSGDKGSKNKSMKQLTKEILKLKNTIKEREAEIADCHMKILSLEEYQEKQNELMNAKSSYEAKINMLIEENQQLKDRLDESVKDKETENEHLQLKHAHEELQTELLNVHHKYTATINVRDARVNELENLLIEYEKQVFNYNNTLQQKDKELTEYVNQITKLNDVSQKLKSTIELLEEEKQKDPNAELVKSLNKQISAYQKKFGEYEEKIRNLEDEKAQLLSLKAALENKNNNLDVEIKKLQESLMEKQTLIKDLQVQQKKYSEEVSSVMLEAKQRDEEIHEIKLQLRKESIENEKLRTSLSQKEKDIEDLILENEAEKKAKADLQHLLLEKDKVKEQHDALEAKNKELMEKLKKFAINIKKKSSMYTELENQLNETQKQLEHKNEQIEQFLIQISTLPSLQEKVKLAEEEITRLQSQKILLEQEKSQNFVQLQGELGTLQEKLAVTIEEMSQLKDSLNLSHSELHFAQEENTNLKTQVDALQNKLVEHEIEQKNNLNLMTKISSLESDINIKQQEINELLNKIEVQEQQLNQVEFGHSAKVQERDLYIETLESEIAKYKNRICRLEEGISAMEDRRHSLERKADQLDSQLQEKQKAYSDYTSQEDQLISRLAVLMDHDRVVEKQLHEIENDNKELHYKIQHFNEENQRLKKALSDIQDHCNTLEEKASRTDAFEAEIMKYQTQVHNLETNLKKLTHEHQTLLVQRKQDIEELETEFNTQIENAIKEKKALSEKYEKINEHVTRLEQKLLEYRNKIETLSLNLEELNKLNQQLIEKSATKVQDVSQDYTEQYINEINNLNALLSSKNQEVNELNNKIVTLQNNNLSNVSALENKITDFKTSLQNASTQVETLCKELNNVKQCNEQLQKQLLQKEEIIKELKDKKRVSFEMNIPKTEGMVISSTIEALSDEEPRGYDMSSIESQIVTDIIPQVESKNTAMKVSEYFQSTPAPTSVSSEKSIEPTIVPKKSYLCYKGEDKPAEEPADPFNSDDGWGLGESEEPEDIVPGFSHLNGQILQLRKENDALKADLEANNVKLLKALKKLKEMKASNDTLSKELKLSKQMSQSSFLDSAIEDELRNNIQELEKNIENLKADLAKENKEKEAIRKQNEVFNSANDRFIEMKEKMDNEVELWKFKFKEVNDKLSSMQWGKDTPEHKPSAAPSTMIDYVNKEETEKLEKENDELQQMVDQLTSQNKDLAIKQSQMTNEINDLHSQIKRNLVCENCENLNRQISELHDNNSELMNNNEQLKHNLDALELRYNEVAKNYDQLKSSRNEMQEKELKDKALEYAQLEKRLQALTISENEARNRIHELSSEIETLKLQYSQDLDKSKFQSSDSLLLSEKYNALEEQCLQGQHEILRLDATNKSLLQKCDSYIGENQQFEERCKDYENKITELNSMLSQNIVNDKSTQSQEIIELNAKIQQLNTENDELLSTVTELRSSIASAVDQRGFEISELWKQHLAQREADFQKTEQELRAELSSAETKYEQLLDSVQSSSQEETNKLIMIEQVNALQSKLQDKEEHLHNLQDKYAEIVNQLDIQRSELEDEKIMHDNKLLAQQDDYEKLMHELRVKHQQFTEAYNESFANVQAELNATKAQNDSLNQQLEDSINKMMELENKITELSNQIKIKDSEIYQKTLEYTHNLSQRNEEFENVRKQLLEYEKKVEDITYEKESELAILRLKIHENTDHYEHNQKELEADKESLTEALNEKIVECTNLNKNIIELKKLLEEQSNRSAEMEAALESQEVEIVTLKDELANLQKTMRMSASKIEKRVSFASDTKPDPDTETSEGELNKELLDAVPRAELDLALYMLHQRDVRCEELTMELTQLLEERDTLQLRLSDSLRSNEELKARCKAAGLDDSLNSSQETVSELPSFSVEREQPFVDIHRSQSSRSSSISDPDGDKPKLQAKLTELRSVRHSRDVRLRQDSEQRQLGLRLMQRDVAQLPPEAREQLAQAHHTLSRDSQSTSTVLLNWLRGKSTPKVVHM